MTIHLISFASLLHKQATLRSSHEAILSELEKYYTVKLVDYQDMDKLTSDDFKIIFIATGGVERLVIQHFERLPRPAILLADGMQNSLAAALEISTWLRGRGMKSEILHGELPAIIQRVHILYNNFRAQRSLFGKRIGVIGTPSSWLVASNVDYLLAKRRWGIEYIDIPLERIYEHFQQITDEQVGASCAAVASQALACREGTPPEPARPPDRGRVRHHQDPHHRGCQDPEGACHRAGRTAGKGGTRYLPLAPRAVGRRRLPGQAQGRRDPHCSTGGGTGRCVRRTDQRALL